MAKPGTAGTAARSVDAQPFNALREAALRHPDVEENLACKGTATESASFRMSGKAFLFLRPTTAMVKLEKSLAKAAALASRKPGGYKTGAGGWTTVNLSEPKPDHRDP